MLANLPRFKDRYLNIGILLSLVFVDMLGANMVIAILPQFFTSYFGANTGGQNLIYGLLIACYPIGQLFGAPIFGYLSDNLGRKKILKLSLTGTTFSYCISFLAICINNLPLLFLARLLDGFTGGNIFIAQSAMLDSSQPKSRSKNLSLISLMIGLGAIIGPIFGGILTELKTPLNQWVPLLSLAMPFFGAFILGSFNIFILSKFFSETKSNPTQVIDLRKINPFYGFSQIFKAFRVTSLRWLFVLSFLLSLGFSIFSNFFPKLLTDKFALTPLLLGSIISYFGVWVFGAVIVCLPLFNRYFKHYQSLYITLFFTAISGMALSFVTQIWGYFLILPMVAIGIALSTPLLTTIISNLSPKDQQSKILGINTSIQALAATAPILAGLIAVYSLELTIFIGFVVYGLAGLIIYFKPSEFDDSQCNT